MIHEIIYSGDNYEEWIWQETGTVRVITCADTQNHKVMLYRIEFYDNHGYSQHVAVQVMDIAIHIFNALVKAGVNEHQPNEDGTAEESTPSVGIPTKDSDGALQTMNDGAGKYAVYKEAGPGWRGGYLVITKAGPRKRRHIEHVDTEQEAKRKVSKYFE